MAPKLYLFHGSPGCRAVMITAKELGIDLEHYELDYMKGEHLSLEFHKLNPQHTAPTLDDNGIVLWDSHAIIAYLVRKYAKEDSLYPKNFQKRAVVDQRLHFDSGVLYPLLRTADMALFTKELKETPARNIQDIKEAYGFLENFLEGQKWVCGNCVTIADFSLVPTIKSLGFHVNLDPKIYPNIVDWIKRAEALPCFGPDQDEQNMYEYYLKNFEF